MAKRRSRARTTTRRRPRVRTVTRTIVRRVPRRIRRVGRRVRRGAKKMGWVKPAVGLLVEYNTALKTENKFSKQGFSDWLGLHIGKDTAKKITGVEPRTDFNFKPENLTKNPLAIAALAFPFIKRKIPILNKLTRNKVVDDAIVGASIGYGIGTIFDPPADQIEGVSTASKQINTVSTRPRIIREEVL